MYYINRKIDYCVCVSTSVCVYVCASYNLSFSRCLGSRLTGDDVNHNILFYYTRCANKHFFFRAVKRVKAFTIY